MPLRVPIFTNFNRELLAVDDFFDNFPKKTPIARALIYSIKVGGGGRRASFPNPILKPEFWNAKQGYIRDLWDRFCAFSRAIWLIPVLWKLAPGKNPAKHTDSASFLYHSPRLHEGNNNACTVRYHPYQAFHKFLPSLEVSLLFPAFTSIQVYGTFPISHCPRKSSKRARNERNIRLPFVPRVIATSALIFLSPSLSILVTIDGD